MANAYLSTFVAWYLAGAFALLVWMALRDVDQMRATLIVLLLWPLVLLLMPVVWLREWSERRGWHVRIKHQPDLSLFGFRRRANGVGWAVRCLRIELQLWKEFKEPRP